MRTIPSAVMTAAGRDYAAAVHLFRFTVGATTWYYAETQLTIGANLYLPYLVVEAGPRHTRAIATKSARVRLDNVDLETAAILKDRRDDLQGAAAVLALYYLAGGTEVPLLTGTIGAAECDQASARITLVGPELNVIQLPLRSYSQYCTWKFKSEECGYVGELTECDKTFAACTVRARTQRFNGFVHITRDLTQLVEGPRRDEPADESSGADSSRPDVMVEP